MANARGKTVDTTHLSIDQAEERGFLHRDYVAHCLRWTHVAKRLSQGLAYRTARVLDVGCGVDLPLAKLLYSSRMIVDQYVGLDYNSAEKFKLGPFHTGKFPLRAFGGIDFADDEQVKIIPGQTDTGDAGLYEVLGMSFRPPTQIVCFEMLEHVEPEHVVRILRKFKCLVDLTPGCLVFASTPCFDPDVGAAANHVNEMRREALGSVIESCGLCVEETYGTFASQRDYRDRFLADFGDAGQRIWNHLSSYYDSNYLATVFAPMYPAHARNNLWVLSGRQAERRKFLPLAAVPTPWSSSERWRDLELARTQDKFDEAAEVA